ncbi:MAG: arylsulfotransferase family protein [Planctomycetota bacterium]|jgi:hypothetical protein
MKLKLIVGILSVLVIIGYFLGFMGMTFLFVLFFPVAAIAVFALGFIVVFLVIRRLVQNWLAPALINDFKKGEKPATAVNVFVGLLSFVLLIALMASTFGGSESHKKGNNSSTLEALKTLPYVSWSPAENDIDKKGVIKYEPDKAFKGINILAPMDVPYVHLIDMEGKILHTWFAQRARHRWHGIVQLCPDGDLLSIVKSRILIRTDWDSNLKWTNKKRYHHEIALADNNDIYVLGRKDETVFIYGFPVPILNDYIAIISPHGKTKREISLFTAAKNNLSFDVVRKIYRWLIKPRNLKQLLRFKKTRNYIFEHGTIFDIFHSNTITIMDRKIEGLCKVGDLLICIRELDLIGVLDIEKEEFIWTWGPGELSRPHHPTFLENGNILIFDNGRIKGYSRIIELEPITKKIVWEYKENPPSRFYSKIRGACQRLPNGNTLITESDKGHAFEVTRNGEIVWEYYNPYVNKSNKKRSVIYRMMRITEPEIYPNLDGLY